MRLLESKTCINRCARQTAISGKILCSAHKKKHETPQVSPSSISAFIQFLPVFVSHSFHLTP